MAASWKETYRFGLEVIDAQHEAYFRLCDSIGECIESGEEGCHFGRLVRLILQLRSYTFQHYQAEEELILGYDIERYFAHTRAHDKFVEQLRVFKDKVEKLYRVDAEARDIGSLITLAQEIHLYCLNWWQMHILGEDTRDLRGLRRTTGAAGAGDAPASE